MFTVQTLLICPFCNQEKAAIRGRRRGGVDNTLGRRLDMVVKMYELCSVLTGMLAFEGIMSAVSELHEKADRESIVHVSNRKNSTDV